jgi:hypothetical protein
MLASILLLAACMVMAQTYGSQDQSSQSSSGMSSSSSGGTQTLDGCLSKSGSDFFLTTSDGNRYQIAGDTSNLSETGGTSKLNAHVGHEIKVTGDVSQASASSSSSSGMSNSQSNGTISARSFQHVAANCSGKK